MALLQGCVALLGNSAIMQLYELNLIGLRTGFWLPGECLPVGRRVHCGSRMRQFRQSTLRCALGSLFSNKRENRERVQLQGLRLGRSRRVPGNSARRGRPPVDPRRVVWSSGPAVASSPHAGRAAVAPHHRPDAHMCHRPPASISLGITAQKCWSTTYANSTRALTIVKGRGSITRVCPMAPSPETT